VRNLKVTIAYRGTNYHGFQIQNNAVTVQGTLEKHLSKVLNEPVSITGCSRTDTGVHANMFCFNVKTNSNIHTLGFCRGVNGELPDDISILSCEEVPMDFHARFDCKGKEYIYKMHCSESKNPFAPDLMFHYRAAAFFCREYCPEVLCGLQTAEEVQDVRGYEQPKEKTVISLD
jgi:tRNA pseudouridine38-40 synthase